MRGATVGGIAASVVLIAALLAFRDPLVGAQLADDHGLVGSLSRARTAFDCLVASLGDEHSIPGLVHGYQFEDVQSYGDGGPAFVSARLRTSRGTFAVRRDDSAQRNVLFVEQQGGRSDATVWSEEFEADGSCYACLPFIAYGGHPEQTTVHFRCAHTPHLYEPAMLPRPPSSSPGGWPDEVAASLRDLEAGPTTDEAARGFEPAMPRGSIVSITAGEDGWVQVDLAPSIVDDPMMADESRGYSMRVAIARTAMWRHPEVEAVRITVGGDCDAWYRLQTGTNATSPEQLCVMTRQQASE